MSCWYASANDRLQLNTERESTYFQGIIPQENRCFFCTQKAVFPINRQDGKTHYPAFSSPLQRRKTAIFIPKLCHFGTWLHNQVLFCFSGSNKWKDIINRHLTKSYDPIRATARKGLFMSFFKNAKTFGSKQIIPCQLISREDLKIYSISLYTMQKNL